MDSVGASRFYEINPVLPSSGAPACLSNALLQHGTARSKAPAHGATRLALAWHKKWNPAHAGPQPASARRVCSPLLAEMKASFEGVARPLRKAK